MGFDLYIMVLIFFISTCQQIPDLILKPVKSIFLAVASYSNIYPRARCPRQPYFVEYIYFITNLTD